MSLPLRRSLLHSSKSRSRARFSGRHSAADLHRLRRRRKIEAGDELHPPQHPQRILAEVVGDMAQHAALEVLHPAPGIERLAGQRIAVDGVDGEIAPRARLLERKERVALGAEGTVAEAELGLAPRQGDVDVVAVDLEDAEGRAHEVERVVAR